MKPSSSFSKLSRVALALSVALAGSRSYAVETALRDPKQLWNPKEETVRHLAHAKVLMADYDLIRADFQKAVPGIESLSDKQIDRILEKYAAIVSQAQVNQQEVNTEIQVDERKDLAYRPHEYRRAHVVPVNLADALKLAKKMTEEEAAKSTVLVDIKGSGAENPYQGYSRNGLAALADMIRDFMYEKAVKLAFKKIEGMTGKHYDTVGTYAVLDAGFNIKHGDGRHERAGLLMRQAHVRYHEGKIGHRELEDPVVLPNKTQLEIELALRQFGITSAIPLKAGVNYSVTRDSDQLNIQGAQDKSVVDFGGFRVQTEFHKPIVYSYSAEGHANVSDADTALAPDQRGFVSKPNPELLLPLNMWGNSVRGDHNDNPLVWSEELAHAVMEGRAGREAAESHFQNFIGPVKKKLFGGRYCGDAFSK